MHAGPARCVLLFAALCLWSSSTSAQILNIEKKRIDKPDDDSLVGNAGLNFSYNNRSPTLQEPVRVMTTGLTSNIGYFTSGNAYFLVNDYQLLRVNENSIVDTGVSHARMQLGRDHLLSYEAYVQYQYDRPRGLDVRALLGAGGRLALVRSEAHNLTAGLGAMYERELWSHPTEDLTVTAHFVKANSYLSSRIQLSEGADFNGVVYYQLGYDQAQEVARQRMTGELNLAVKVVGALSLTSSLQAAYETRPLVPILRFIYATNHGVRVDF